VRILLQRVTSAEVRVGGAPIASIGNGLLALVGVTATDTSPLVDLMAGKTANLRVFDDESGVMNLSALDTLQGAEHPASVLVVSQFTLYADCRKGRRPSYIRAARPELAKPLVEQFANHLCGLGLTVKSGAFGAEMAVEMVNDGPVTIMLDSDDLQRIV